MKKYLYISLILFFIGCGSETKEDYYDSKLILNYELKEIDSLNYIKGSYNIVI